MSFNQEKRKPPIYTKTFAHRSRFGCSTCRKRRIKCDETLPICSNCSNNKDLRCGYLDQTPQQFEMMRNNHLNHQGYEQRARISFNEEERSVNQQYLDNTNNIFNHAYPRTISNDSTRTNSPMLNNHYVNIRLIPHDPGLDKFQFHNLLNSYYYFKDDFKSNNHEELIFKATKNQLIYHSILILSIGNLIIKLPSLKTFYLKFRNDCLKLLLKGLPYLTDDNIKNILNLSISLDVSSIYWKIKSIDDYKLYSKLTIGPFSILETIYNDPYKFPNSLKSIKINNSMNHLIKSTKSLWIPNYDYRILFEFKKIILEFGNNFIISTNFNLFNIIKDIKTKFLEIIVIIDNAIDIFANHHQKIIDLNDSSNNNFILKYPFDKLYELFQLWFHNVPSESSILDSSQISCVEKVFYILWLTLFKELEVIISSSTYFFTFFCHGAHVFLLNSINKQNLINDLEKNGDLKLIWYFNYCSRILSFFDKRNMLYLLSNSNSNSSPNLSETLPNFFHLSDRLKIQNLNVEENCIITFKNTVIKKFHYPSHDNNNNNNSITMNNDYIFEDFNITDHNYEIYEDSRFPPLFENYFENEVDLLNNFNQETSLLNNDYHPRITERGSSDITTCLYESNHVDLEFISKFVKDRKLLIQMIENS